MGGVGADDVFVLVDAWKQSKKENDKDYLLKRVSYSYHRTYRAVFNTSLTTAMAFVGTGISPLMGFSTFGWFAAICIVINYLYVISFTPAALLLLELYIRPFMDKYCGTLKCCKMKVDALPEKEEEKKKGAWKTFTFHT